jgi:hypothetical protein
VADTPSPNARGRYPFIRRRRVPIDHMKRMRMRQQGQAATFGAIRRQREGSRSAEAAPGPMASSTSWSLRSEWVLQYGGRHLALPMRNAQLEQVLDERCRRGGTNADEDTARAADRDAAPAGPIRVRVNCCPSMLARPSSPIAWMTRFQHFAIRWMLRRGFLVGGSRPPPDRRPHATRHHDISVLHRWNSRMTAPGHAHIIKKTSWTFTVDVTRVALAWFQLHIRRTVGSNWTIAMAPVWRSLGVALRLASGDQHRAVPQSAPPPALCPVGHR